MIVEKVLEAKARKITQYPVHTNRASDLGNPCVRYHVLNRTRWQEKAMHGAGLQMIFDLGNVFEDTVLKDLAEAGIPVIEQQRPFEWKEYQITGHVDGKILMDGEAIPLEIKSCSPLIFPRINTIDDLKNGKYGYLRKYSHQLNLYLLMDNKERGLFIFKDKSTGKMKEIWMDIDYDLGEETLKRAQAINAHIANGTMPEPINEEMWCNGCAFAHVCLPEHIGKEVEIDTGELAAMLDRMEELKDAAKEYRDLNDSVTALLKGREKVLADNWFITGKWCERTSYDIPDFLKEKYKKVTTYWQKKIQKVA